MEARQVRAFLRQYDPYTTGCRNSSDVRKGDSCRCSPIGRRYEPFLSRACPNSYDCEENGVTGLQNGLEWECRHANKEPQGKPAAGCRAWYSKNYLSKIFTKYNC
jgi:hypothetical protein